MVSGFLTSPCDHERIISGDAIEMRIALNANGFLGFSKNSEQIFHSCAPWLIVADLCRDRFTRSRFNFPTREHFISTKSRTCIADSRIQFGRARQPPALRLLEQLDVEAERLELLDHDVERFGQPGSSVFSPLTIASYIRVRPATSSDLTVNISCSV